MLGASLYIIACSTRNRMRKRLERLRQPRYLAGAAAALAYFYISIFGPFRANRARAARRGVPDPALRAGLRIAALAPGLVGLLMLALSAIAWVLPFDSGLIDFSDAEIQLLMPAPVSRRALLVHRMLRLQIGILVSAVITSLVFSSAAGYARLQTALAMWVALFSMKIYFTGVTLARARLGSAAHGARRAAWAPMVAIAGITVFVVAAIGRAFIGRPVTGVVDAMARIQTVATSGPTGVLLWPFVALGRPVFATGTMPFLTALASAVGILAVLTVWVLESDHALQDAMADLAIRRAGPRPAGGSGDYKAGLLRWRLEPSGRPETAFLWKAALQTFRIVDRRSLLRLGSLIAVLVFMAVTLGRQNGFTAMLGSLAVFGALFTIAMAPQVLRVDLRQDLRHLEVLKTWPIRAGAIIRGELLWPGLFLSAMAWLLIGLAILLSAAFSPRMFFSGLSVQWRLWGGVAAAILAPALIFAQLLIHNGIAVLFPGWIALGRQRSRGLDAMGQRLIILGGTWLTLIVMAVPGALAGGLLWFAFQRFIGGLALPLAAITCTTILGIEVLIGSEALGPAYERLDVLAIERADD